MVALAPTVMTISGSTFHTLLISNETQINWVWPKSFGHYHKQCSRLMPSYQFRFEGLSNFSLSFERLVQIQDVNPRI